MSLRLRRRVFLFSLRSVNLHVFMLSTFVDEPSLAVLALTLVVASSSFAATYNVYNSVESIRLPQVHVTVYLEQIKTQLKIMMLLVEVVPLALLQERFLFPFL